MRPRTSRRMRPRLRFAFFAFAFTGAAVAFPLFGVTGASAYTIEAQVVNAPAGVQFLSDGVAIDEDGLNVGGILTLEDVFVLRNDGPAPTAILVTSQTTSGESSSVRILVRGDGISTGSFANKAEVFTLLPGGTALISVRVDAGNLAPGQDATGTVTATAV